MAVYIHISIIYVYGCLGLKFIVLCVLIVNDVLGHEVNTANCP